MPEQDSTPSASAPLADVPRMPDPRVREFTAHSIDSGLALPFGLVGLLLGAGMIAAAPGCATTRRTVSRCVATPRRSPRSSLSNLHARVEAAGVSIIESRFTHLAYAPEIASAMLQRQQAGAVVAARREIVDGAVGMVEAALARIAVGVPPTPLRQWGREIVELGPERKAAMVSNLLVVLCGDRAPQPVLNTGSPYQ